MENLCCARKHSVRFFVQGFYTVKLHCLTSDVWGPLDGLIPNIETLVTIHRSTRHNIPDKLPLTDPQISHLIYVSQYGIQ